MSAKSCRGGAEEEAEKRVMGEEVRPRREGRGRGEGPHARCEAKRRMVTGEVKKDGKRGREGACVRAARTCMPRIAKMSCRTRMTATTLETAGSALKSELMISFMPALREMRRSGRSTRSTRRMRSGRRKGRCSASIERSIVETIAKSRWFHTLEKSANRVGR